MDLNMPVMDGLQACKILKSKMQAHEIPQTPIVAVTAGRCEDAAIYQDYLEAGFADAGTHSLLI